MEWLVTYRYRGETRHMRMNTRGLPNIKAIAFSILSLEQPGLPAPSRPIDRIEGWLEELGYVITDIRLLRQRPGQAPVGPYSELLSPRRNEE